MAGPLHLKVFLSSPGDVAAERELARRLIKDELASDPLLRSKVTFDVFSWDDPAVGVLLLATMTPQEAVNRIDRPADCDITIVILWSKLGSPLRGDAFRKPSGEPYLSGTEWEYEDACTEEGRAANSGSLRRTTPQRCLVHQAAHGEVGQQQAPELLPDQLGGLAAQDDACAAQVRLQFGQRPLISPRS
jgi:hypothetical protein